MAFFKKNSEVKNLREELKIVFSKIKEELEDHLESINQNTLEIHSNYEYISLLNNKIDKLAEKIAKIELKLKEIGLNNYKEEYIEKKKVENIFLTREEEELLALLLDYKRKKSLLSYKTISEKLNVSKNYAIELVNSLLEKKIPIEKKYFDEKIFLELNNNFLKNNNVEYNFITID